MIESNKEEHLMREFFAEFNLTQEDVTLWQKNPVAKMIINVLQKRNAEILMASPSDKIDDKQLRTIFARLEVSQEFINLLTQ